MRRQNNPASIVQKMRFLFKYKVILLTCLCGFTLLSCKTRKLKVGQGAPDKPAVIVMDSFEQLLANVNSHKNISDAIYYKADAEYKDAQFEVTLDIEVQALRDQYIWLNARAMGLLNVARIIIRPDSIRIIDLQRKLYISASYNFMRSFTSAPIQFEQLQNMVWGNAMFDPKLPAASLDSFSKVITILMELGATQQVSVYNDQLKTQVVSLTEQARNRQMTVNYGNFLRLENNSFPQQIIINIQGEKKLGCKFTLNNFATELKREPQFVVPKSYKVQVY